MAPFDPYLNWLGIPPHEQPPNYYRLLGVVLFESDPEVIRRAADLQSLRVGGFQAGPQGEMCQQLLSEIAVAQYCLLDPQHKAAYDAQLSEGLSRRGERYVAAPPPPGPVAGPMAGLAQVGGRAMPLPQSSVPMPRPAVPAALPVAIPVAAPVAAVVAPRAQSAGLAAAPVYPPGAPPQPLDELADLAAEGSARRFRLKKKADNTAAIMIGSTVAVAVLLGVIYLAVGGSKSGYGTLEPEKPESSRNKLAEILKQQEQVQAKQRAKEKEEQRRAAARALAAGSASPGKPDGKVAKRPKTTAQADDGESAIVAPHQFGPPSRTMDSPDKGSPVGPGPQPDGHDTPMDAGGPNDPVMDPPEK